MPTKQETDSSNVGYKIIRSFENHRTGDFYKRLIHHEEELIGNLQKDRSEPPFQTFEDAGRFAAAEIGALAYDYPQLIRITPQFPWLYRFLRASDLFYNLPRGGKTLMVGSGSTIPEFLAQYIKIPTQDKVEHLLDSWKPLMLSNRVRHTVRETEQRGYPEKPIGLLPGLAVAVEPDENSLLAAEGTNRFFAIPTHERIIFLQSPIEEVLVENAIPKNTMDSILWHRAEPLFLTRPDFLDLDEQYLQRLLTWFNSLLAPGGHMIISVGGGNDKIGKDLRRTFLQKISEMLAESEITVLSSDSIFFDDEPANSLFFNHAAGMIGAVVARKDKKLRSIFGFRLKR